MLAYTSSKRPVRLEVTKQIWKISMVDWHLTYLKGYSRPYQLDESSSNFRLLDVSLCFYTPPL